MKNNNFTWVKLPFNKKVGLQEWYTLIFALTKNKFWAKQFYMSCTCFYIQKRALCVNKAKTPMLALYAGKNNFLHEKNRQQIIIKAASHSNMYLRCLEPQAPMWRWCIANPQMRIVISQCASQLNEPPYIQSLLSNRMCKNATPQTIISLRKASSLPTGSTNTWVAYR